MEYTGFSSAMRATGELSDKHSWKSLWDEIMVMSFMVPHEYDRAQYELASIFPGWIEFCTIEQLVLTKGAAFEILERIVIATGPYSCLNEQELNFYFHVAQENTCMEGARITVERDESLIGISQMYVRSIEGE